MDRNTPFGLVTDSLVLSEKFNVRHDNILRAIKKCQNELSHNISYNLEMNIIESSYLAGPKGKERKERKVDVTEFGLALLLLYINSPKARQISAEIPNEPYPQLFSAGQYLNDFMPFRRATL